MKKRFRSPGRWYIKAMSRLTSNRLRQVFSLCVMTAFFCSQVFSCCIVNHKLGAFLKNAFATGTVSESAHACCPKTVAAPEKPGAPVPSGCCIQDANRKLPQIASDKAGTPDMTGLVVAVLPITVQDAPEAPAPRALRSGSSPPLYLTQLRLLI
ncbi:MAG: hypothetical protein JWP91_4271 [Fibrobacteres bacterium]|nr:hypothetical protein [Fibrobacterota bacterium]